MKWNILIASLVLSMGLSAPSFGFDLLDRMLGTSGGGCGCEPTCAAPAATCGCPDACATSCCKPKSCCSSLFARKPKCCAPKCCPSTACGCPEATCAAPAAACGCPEATCAAPADCGCAPACDPCCKPKCCRRTLHDVLSGLFACNKCCPKKCAPACGCASACGCDNGCGGGAPSMNGNGGEMMPPMPMSDPAARARVPGRVVPSSFVR